MRHRFKTWFLNLIRPMFVRNIDPREDYECVICGEPVLRRHLTCSRRCGEQLDRI